MFLEPSAPPLIDLLRGSTDENNDAAAAPVVISSSAECHYNCEAGCDVEFLVGKGDEDLIRIPVHSQKLREYPVFNAMLSEDFQIKYNVYYGSGFDEGNEDARHQCRKLRQIRINRVEGKSFDNVMKYIYKQPVHLQNPEITVETLKAAHEFLLPGLVRACVKHLNKMISLSNVLFIFANVRYLCNDLDNLEELVQAGIHLPLPKRRKQSILKNSTHNNNKNSLGAATTLGVSEQQSMSLVDMKNLCVWLLCQSLSFIDVHADRVLESDEIEDLSNSYLKFLLSRNSLDVSETVVFSALVRWAETECKRQHLPLTSESKRHVIHDLLYVVRYLQMTPFEFLSGPGDSGLLLPEEVEFIKNILFLHHNTRLSYSQSTKRNFSCDIPSSTVFINQSEEKNVTDKLQVLKLHWKYLSQPRTPRLRNGVTSSLNDKDRKRDQNRRKSSLFEGWIDGKGPKKGYLKFKRIGFIVKKYCVPCTSPKSKRGWNADIFQKSFQHRASEHLNLIINNDLNNEVGTPSHKNGSIARATNAAARPRTLTRSESSFSKACDYTLRAFAFFFD